MFNLHSFLSVIWNWYKRYGITSLFLIAYFCFNGFWRSEFNTGMLYTFVQRTENMCSTYRYNLQKMFVSSRIVMLSSCSFIQSVYQFYSQKVVSNVLNLRTLNALSPSVFTFQEITPVMSIIGNSADILVHGDELLHHIKLNFSVTYITWY